MRRRRILPQRTQSLFGHADHVVRAPIGALEATIAAGNIVFFVANNLGRFDGIETDNGFYPDRIRGLFE